METLKRVTSEFNKSKAVCKAIGMLAKILKMAGSGKLRWTLPYSPQLQTHLEEGAHAIFAIIDISTVYLVGQTVSYEWRACHMRSRVEIANPSSESRQARSQTPVDPGAVPSRVLTGLGH